MRKRLWLILSLGLNVVLAGWLATRHQGWSVSRSDSPQIVDVTLPVKTNIVVRHENFTWSEVESTNYITYIKNLRAIGCPEATIRDLIVAEVNQIFSRRLAAEILSEDYQWWRTDADRLAAREISQKSKKLETERRNLLTELLGPGWETDSKQSLQTGIVLNGPILGSLSDEVKQAVYQIYSQMQQKIADYQQSQRQQNLPIDPVELARIRWQMRQDLLVVLTPDAYEEFLLRYSDTAKQMRSQLQGVSMDPDEFRSLFQALDPIEVQPAYYYSGNDPAQTKTRDQLQTQADAAMKQALGDDAYAALQLSRDPLYRSTKTVAEQLGVSTETIMPIYQINKVTQAELDRIRNDDTLSNDEKVEALAAAQVEQQKSLQQLLGPEAFQRWLTNQAPQNVSQ